MHLQFVCRTFLRYRAPHAFTLILLIIWNLNIGTSSFLPICFPLTKLNSPGSQFSHMLYVLSSQVNKHHNIWELLTFKFVNPMMDTGITRQLDFTDLLELPAELRAGPCYDKLLSSWTSEHQNHHADSSLLRAMSYAYGWTYLRLGLLKVPFFLL